MSEFGNFLKAVIDRSDDPSYEFASRMGIAPSHLSRIIASPQPVGVNVQTLAKMLEGISREGKIRAGLLQAYFRDQVLPELRSWVHVDPPGPRAREEPEERDPISKLERALRQLALPTDVVRAIHTLVTLSPDHPEIHDLMKELGSFVDAIVRSCDPNSSHGPKTRVLYADEPVSASRVREESKSSVDGRPSRRKENKKAVLAKD